MNLANALKNIPRGKYRVIGHDLPSDSFSSLRDGTMQEALEVAENLGKMTYRLRVRGLAFMVYSSSGQLECSVV